MIPALPLALLLAAAQVLPAGDPVLDRQAAVYRTEAAKTILDLQPFRRTEQLGGATLVNLNPAVNRWLVLALGQKPGYHLDNPDPSGQEIHLEPAGLRLVTGGTAADCPLAAESLQAAQRSGLPYAPLCDGRLYLRNRVAGRSSTLERVTDMLRDNLWGGDAIVGFVRREFYADRFADRGKSGVPAPGAAVQVAADSPAPALLRAPAPGDRPVVPTTLGIALDGPSAALVQGSWYQAAGVEGVKVSFVQPQRVAPEGVPRGSVNAMDTVEAAALAYFVAFDLDRYDLGFALGTDHPRVGWSDRAPDRMRAALPGPDGIATAAPLVANGMVAPWRAARTVATFTGGFKREHGAFKYGDLAQRNHGSHYGFIEQGAIFSKLQPGLATVYVLDDGTVGMKTWAEADDALLPRLRDARQNGVPLIDYDSETNLSAPGPLVPFWGPGNWSGTAEEKLRSLRAGLCLQVTATHRFLIYGWFSSATPSTMARVFQAYGCRYAMHLDMNALEHTYLALYRRDGGSLEIEHLAAGMDALDTETDAGVLPRFLAVPDDRDFFYLMRREAKP
jgi:hypothetical protein